MRSAYLDIDGTLVEDGLWSCLVQQLLYDGLGKPEPLQRCLADLDDPAVSGMAAVRRDIPEALEHATQGALQDTAARAWQRARPMPFLLPLANLLTRSEVRVVLISGAPQMLAEKVGEIFETDSVHACVVRAGTGGGFSRLVDSAEAKSDLIRQVALDRGENLAGAIAMGNGHYDVGMLAHVGSPIAFEPSLRLREQADEQGWPITDRNGVMGCMRSLLEL